jgi:hypothetical protein
MPKLEPIEELRDLVKIQCSDGTWNYDPYMLGMANGMILALALMEKKDPRYLSAPETWLKDVDETQPKSGLSGEVKYGRTRISSRVADGRSPPTSSRQDRAARTEVRGIPTSFADNRL